MDLVGDDSGGEHSEAQDPPMALTYKLTSFLLHTPLTTNYLCNSCRHVDY